MSEISGVTPTGRKRLLVSARRPHHLAAVGMAAAGPEQAASFLEDLKRLPGVDHVRTITPQSGRRLEAMAAMSAHSTSADVHVLEVDAATAVHLGVASEGNSSFVIEEDAALHYGEPPKPALVAPQAAGVAVPLRFLVLGDGGRPLAGAEVSLVTPAGVVTGTTDAMGTAVVAVSALPVLSLQVIPRAGYWDYFVTGPQLSPQAVTQVQMVSLQATVDGFPQGFKYGWGQKLMGLDELPPGLSGAGVRVAIIDSGLDGHHPAFKRVTSGRDVRGPSASGWRSDEVGHGTHCAGIIGGGGASVVRGFAAGAEIHVVKIFPGGSFSNLLDALDYCIEQEIDVVNLSLGADQGSEAIEAALEECVAHGVACIVAAGNSGGPVQYPARSPNVLAVAAIGQTAWVLPSSWDATQYQPALATAEGVFSPTFTCHGPEVAVCAPGVGIVSTYPESSYKPESGTSMATPHVTGLAALLLAHYPLFREPILKPRGPERVRALFALLREIASPVGLDRARAGAGLPTLQAVASVLMAGPAPRPERSVEAAAAHLSTAGLSSFTRHEGLVSTLAARAQGLGDLGRSLRPQPADAGLVSGPPVGPGSRPAPPAPAEPPAAAPAGTASTALAEMFERCARALGFASASQLASAVGEQVMQQTARALVANADAELRAAMARLLATPADREAASPT